MLLSVLKKYASVRILFFLLTLGQAYPYVTTIYQDLVAKKDCACCVLKARTCSHCAISGHNHAPKKMATCHLKKRVSQKQANRLVFKERDCSSHAKSALMDFVGDPTLPTQGHELIVNWNQNRFFQFSQKIENRNHVPLKPPPQV